MNCPCCDVEMVVHEGRNECPECGHSEEFRFFQRQVDEIIRWAEKETLPKNRRRRAAHSK